MKNLPKSIIKQQLEKLEIHSNEIGKINEYDLMELLKLVVAKIDNLDYKIRKSNNKSTIIK